MTTKLDQTVVEKHASNYETTRDNLKDTLRKAGTEAQGLATTSSSAATQALNHVIELWVNNTSKTLLDENMTDIARIIRHAKDDQITADDENAKQIQNLMEGSALFLGG